MIIVTVVCYFFSKLAIEMTSISKFKKRLSVYTLDRSFHDQAEYLLKNAKNACMDSQFCSSQCMNIFCIDKVSPKENSYISFRLSEKFSTAKFPPLVFVIPEVPIFAAKVIFCKQCLTRSLGFL